MKIAHINVPAAPQAAVYQAFLKAVAAHGFKGEIEQDYAKRIVFSTDNSVYQRLPQASVFPKSTDDLVCLARLAAEPAYQAVVLTARGGGTGTNGQSLTDGIVVDVSRHMNQILTIDAKARTAVVQAGVVKDQLNAALKPYGLFFAPELSTSNRATIGGMINTDASGQGSCTYGKTRDHVLGLKTVLLGGTVLDTVALTAPELATEQAQAGLVGQIYQTVDALVSEHAAAIEATFPKLNRCLTGYDLPHIKEAGMFNLNNLLCGSEGSLGFVTEANINLLPIPTQQVLVNIRYADFQAALRDAKALMALKPLSIETVDSKVLQLAKADFVWHSVAEYFPDNADGGDTLGINLVEFCGDDLAALQATVADFIQHLGSDTTVIRLGHTVAVGAKAVNTVYGMRKRSVGLLGNVKGEVRPQPFVEDTAVPPENLADYIAEFRAVLDEAGLAYGMFGHVDAGVLHVRPALDMKDPLQAAKIREITDQVVDLVHKYGGVLWGEHGKGLRSGYAPKFFGALYPVLQQIKALFDPHNQLNPGKIATPSSVPEAKLTQVDEVPFRGDLDRQIAKKVWYGFQSAVHCNGNGACYNYDVNDAMCPSWKATRDRMHAPKGRASLVREWLRLQEQAGVDVLACAPDAQKTSWLGATKATLARVQHSWQSPRAKKEDFSHQVYEAMNGCLSCKSCAGQCPIKVNVPDFKSRFLYLYHTRYLRPLKDYAVGALEYTLPYVAKAPKLYNALLSNGVVDAFMRKVVGLVDSPKMSTLPWAELLQQHRVQEATVANLARLSETEKQRSIVLVQDAFTRYFETPLLADWMALLQALNVNIFVLPFMPNGKPLHVHGFLSQFKKLARRNTQVLNQIAQQGIPLVGMDPAMTLVYRQEYVQVLDGSLDKPEVLLPQEWLSQLLNAQAPAPALAAAEPYYLMGHCTEKTNAPEAAQQWVSLFAAFGLKLVPMASGCCGMSGTYGHESQHQATSATIYQQSWQPIVAQHGPSGRLLSTGYSCRSQVKRMSEHALSHPLQILLKNVQGLSAEA
ncbi:MAG: FAD-binding oxidoreductase [Neisseriaceae bacterium]|nr:FAD-binding oxidoreductase [Neisseriaceae bacterium]